MSRRVLRTPNWAAILFAIAACTGDGCCSDSSGSGSSSSSNESQGCVSDPDDDEPSGCGTYDKPHEDCEHRLGGGAGDCCYSDRDCYGGLLCCDGICDNYCAPKPDARTPELPPGEVELAGTVTGWGTIASTPTGLACDDACSITVAEDTAVTIAATPYFGAELDSWTGDCAANLGPSCSLTASQDRSFGAAFSGGLGRWPQLLSGTTDETVADIASDADGNVVVVGTYDAQFLAGSEALTAAGSGDGFAVFLDAAGEVSWSVSFGSLGDDAASAVAFASNGDVIIAGRFSDDLGLGSVTGALSDLFAARFQPDGQLVWAKGLGGPGLDVVTSMAVDDNDNLILAGLIDGVVNLGGSDLGAASTFTPFLLRLDGNGDHVWSRELPSTLLNPHVAATGARVLVGGAVSGPTDFGGGPLTLFGSSDVVIASLDANGVHVWSRSGGGPGQESLADIATDSNGRVVLVGSYADGAAFGGASLLGGGAPNGFVVVYDAAGVHTRSLTLYGEGTDSPESVAVGPNDEIVVGGRFTDTIALGAPGVFSSGGGDDGFLVSYDSAGTFQWAHVFGGADQDGTAAVAVDTSGNVACAGHFEGSVEFDQIDSGDSALRDIFVLRRGP